jgi:hypothetical protein
MKYYSVVDEYKFDETVILIHDSVIVIVHATSPTVGRR